MTHLKRELWEIYGVESHIGGDEVDEKYIRKKTKAYYLIRFWVGGCMP